MRRILGIVAVLLAAAAISCELASPANKEGARREKRPGVLTLTLSMGGGGSGSRMARTIAPDEKTVSQFVVRVEDANGSLDPAYPDPITIPAAANTASLDLALESANTGLTLAISADLAAGGSVSGRYTLQEADFISGDVAITLTGGGASAILLPVAFPASLGIDTVSADLTSFDDAAFHEAQNLTPVPAGGSDQQVTVSFANLSAAGNYRLRLDFKRSGLVVKTVGEAVIVEKGFLSNRWSAHDGTGWQDTLHLTAADFPGADPSLTLTVKSGGTAVQIYADTLAPENLYVALGDIASPTAAALEVSLALHLGARFEAQLSGTGDITSSFSYAEAPAVYRKTLTGENLESGSWALAVTGTAADGVAVKTYTLRPARAELGQASARSYHLTLAGAVSAAAGSSAAPDRITLLSDHARRGR